MRSGLSWLLLLGLLVLSSHGARQLRLAFAFSGPTSDFGWNFHANLARITVMEALAARHPDMDVSHDYALIPDSWTEYCHPQFDVWLRSGVNVIISAAATQLCMTRLARAYPNVTFLCALSSPLGPPNFAVLNARLDQPIYLTGYTAGLVTKAKKVCISSMISIPQVVLNLMAFCRGIRSADPRVDIHIFRTEQAGNPLLEMWIVNQSYALGCDVVWVQSTGIEGTVRAQQLGLLSIGLLTDARLTVGEGVLTSSIMDLAPAYLRAVEAALNGTLWQETQKPDWWMGWEWGVMRLADFSFLVPKAVQSKVLAQVPMLDKIFCGRVCTKTRCLCNSSTCCLTDAQRLSLDSYPDFVQDHGVMTVPGQACRAGQTATWHLDTFTMQCTDCPAGTYAYNADQVSECRPCPATTYSVAGSTTCTACPPGTFGDRAGQGRCTPCAAGSFSTEPAATMCSPCPSGLSNRDGTQCEAAPLTWVAALGGGVGGGLGLVLLLLWWVRKHGLRNNRAAPKDPAQPFCVVFTDIQGSTGLWATIPEVMAHALDAHHAIIRSLIAKHHCYEVKTIGDSFMCATKSPAQAVRFALAVQEEFVRHDWGTDRIDRAYDDAVAETRRAPDCWNGLRVRVGIHYGHGDIRLDPVSRGYDYYGTVVNTAARIESICHGGQVGVSEAVFAAVGGHFPHAVFTDLGSQQLRGLLEPLRLYQVLPEGPLAQRSFPPLRIDRVEELEDPIPLPPRSQGGKAQRVYPASICSSLGPGAAWAENHALVVRGDISSAELQRHYHVLQVGLSTLLTPLGPGPKQRVMRWLCSHLHVPNHGMEGPQLLHTLHGLIKRVLPATVVQGHGQVPGLEKQSSQHVSDPGGGRRSTLRSVA